MPIPPVLRSHWRLTHRDDVIWLGSLPLGRGHRVELRVHLFFVLTCLALTSALALSVLPRVFPGWAPAVYWLVATAVTAIDSVLGLLHELGHAIVALARGRKVYRITLYGLAAAARRSSGANRPRDQFSIAIAGPISHLLVASALLVTWTVLPNDNEPLRVATGFPALSNLVVGAFNLLPVSPLDGGRAARAVIAALLRL